MGSEKSVTLVRRLFEQTNAGTLEWVSVNGGAAFQVGFAGYGVLLERRQQRDEFGHPHDQVMLSIVNGEGQIVEQILPAELGSTLPNPEKVMIALFEGARRRAMGVEKALDSILAALGSPRDSTRPA
ncbi:MAG TPA: hypothetical protein VKA21_14705 [Candidatus Binatia bacterium]|nr:hypothetical protein [Candidatus Binatia bacterium]